MNQIQNIKILMVTLGCAKNTVESEYIEGYLKNKNLKIISEPQDADVIIVNTCGFIEIAKQEAIDTILELTEYKNNGRCKALIAAGCLAQRYPDELLKEMPEIDAVVGILKADVFDVVIKEVLNGKRIKNVDSNPSTISPSEFRNINKNPSAYLQISDGCNNFCSFCAIPFIRGRYRSKSIESLVNEAETLVKNGVKEICLIGQDITKYGIDLNNGSNLISLLNSLLKIPKIEWIRLLYLQPEGISDELIQSITDNEKICNYLDIPFQHASPKILKMMKRWGTGKDYLALISKLRKKIPDLAIRTSIIVGFPGETEGDFKELVSFIKEAEFDYAGIFQYSKEEDTAAALYPNHTTAKLKQYRYDQIRAIADSISFKINESLINKTFNVLIEKVSCEGGFDCEGRIFRQAPEVDGSVLIKSFKDKSLKIGNFVKIKIKSTENYDFLGEINA
ncbi:MAG: 30S ribosomal protein S12 methylthiotransferase RimO [Actinobacteria bacterium]|nr:30S ribosomal protein S12 methylthiotransferase RimO [Actinomycetota bacterium]